jgi:predicted AAA+ superfamily ATPase
MTLMTPREIIGYGLDALVIFRRLQEDPVIRALMQFCHTDKGNLPAQIRFYSAMVAALYEKTENLTEYIQSLVLEHEHVCVIRTGAGEEIPAAMQRCLDTELALFQRIAMLTSAQLQAEIDYTGPLPVWNVHQIDLKSAYETRIAAIHQHGYGIYARYHMFTVTHSGTIVPVEHPDPIRLENMVGYEIERKAAADNILALLDGNFAANVLLSGDAGTGKSATVKAIANTYRDRGLRLIELTKDQLCYIPQIMDRLCKNPLKFILFIDDLTFSEDDPNFGTLKATLEGSIAARMRNTVIYATSNRRHLVKETFDDGSDKHQNDTIQERISLSERFGITITYSKPQKPLYLQIVQQLANQAGLHMDPQQLALKAEQFALCKSGRSARAARQLVDQLLTQQNTKRESD